MNSLTDAIRLLVKLIDLDNDSLTLVDHIQLYCVRCQMHFFIRDEVNLTIYINHLSNGGPCDCSPRKV